MGGWEKSELEASSSKHPPGAIQQAAGWAERSPFLLCSPGLPLPVKRELAGASGPLTHFSFTVCGERGEGPLPHILAQYSSEQPGTVASRSPWYTEASEAPRQSHMSKATRLATPPVCWPHDPSAGSTPQHAGPGQALHNPRCSPPGPGAGEPVSHRGGAGEGGPAAAGAAAGVRRRRALQPGPRGPCGPGSAVPLQVLAGRPVHCFR